MVRAAPLLIAACTVALLGCGSNPAPRAAQTPSPTPTPTPTPTASPHARSSSRAVVLGEYGFVTGAVGWGAAHPQSLTVGGDPALVVHNIRWHGWGRPHARGIGRASAFNGHGGSSYQKQVRVELRAYELGRCEASGPRAYRNLRLRMPKRPGAPMGQWFVLGGGDQGLCRR